jgi:predicted nucleic acid-binding protein
MPTRFLDTNILLYSISTQPAEIAKREIAIGAIENGDNAISVQVLQEFYVQATRATFSGAIAHEDAVALVLAWLRFPVQDITLPLMNDALAIKAAHRLSYWDAAIVAAARALGCREVLSEDMAHGRQIDGIVIVNPFR